MKLSIFGKRAVSREVGIKPPISPPARPSDVDWCYRQYLGREPDDAGRSDWLSRVEEEITLDEMRYHFIASPEFHARSSEKKLEALSVLGDGSPRLFSLKDILTVRAASYVDVFRNEVLAGSFDLPEGFDRSIPPSAPAYREQQLALWRAITQRDNYNPETDEDTPEIANLDLINRPAFYIRGDANLAGEHIVALGHILKLSDLREGARALEYGAGFGQIALSFARLGIQVDTVDINPHFCDAVDKLAERYQVNLKSHIGQYGDNPSKDDHSYDLIYFYESFHHCLNFEDVIPRLSKMLKPSGKIIMAGEPILVAPEPLLPYPWGLRMDGENVIIMRDRGWMELGFMEDFLLPTFARHGFRGSRHALPGFHYPTAYVFVRDA